VRERAAGISHGGQCASAYFVTLRAASNVTTSVDGTGVLMSSFAGVVEMDSGGKSDILGALLQNGASMSRTSIAILLCPRIPMSW
jgi:hypothetical protein